LPRSDQSARLDLLVLLSAPLPPLARLGLSARLVQ
jgi:hypothetical protein